MPRRSVERRTPTEAERRKPIKLASLQNLMYHLETDAAQPTNFILSYLFFQKISFQKYSFQKYFLCFQSRHFNATHFGFPLPLPAPNVASFKSALLALFKFPIKIKVPHLEGGGVGRVGVLIKMSQ